MATNSFPLYIAVLLAIMHLVCAASLSGLIGFWTWGVWVIGIGGFALVIGGIVLCIVCCAKQKSGSRGAVVYPQATVAAVQQQHHANNTQAGYPVGTQGYPNQGYPNQGYPDQGYPSADIKAGFGPNPPAYGTLNSQYGQPPPYGSQATQPQAQSQSTQQIPIQPANTDVQTPAPVESTQTPAPVQSNQTLAPVQSIAPGQNPPGSPANLYN